MQQNAENTATVNSTDGSSVSSALEHFNESSDGFLKLDAGGVVGFLERIPLWLKLLLITLLATFIILGLAGWLIGVEAQRVDRTVAHNRYTKGFLTTATLANLVQRERGAGVLFLAVPTEQNMRNYKDTFADCDQMYAEFSSLAWFDKKSFTTYNGQLFNEIRESVVSRRASTFDIYKWYSDFAEQLLQLLEKETQEKGNQTDYISGQGFFLRVRTTVGMLRSFASVAFMNNNVTLSIIYQDIFKRLIERRNTQIEMWKATSTAVHVDYAQRTVWSIPEYAPVTAMEKRALDASSETFSSSVDVVEWTSHKTAVLAAYETAFLSFLAENDRESSAQLTDAIVNIVIVCVCVIVFTAIYALISFCFSRTIIGPWVRMNKLQEAVTYKFVPRGFLRMIGCESITQVQIGKHSTRSIVIMRICIRDYWQQVQQFTVENRILYTNRFYDMINPLLSNFGGYIDTMSADELQVCFKNASAALSCAKKIHHQIKTMNLSDFAPLNVTIAIHAAVKADLAVIGDQERIQGVVISRLAREVRLMANVAIRFQCKTVISNNLMELLTEKLEGTQLIAMIGGSSHFVMYELASGLNKSEKEQFSKAVRDVFVEHNLVDALNYFKTSDAEAAKFYVQVCSQVLDICKSELTSVNVEDILKEPSLEEIMEHTCKKEQSTENLNIYKLIKQFKEAFFAQDLARKQECANSIKEYIERANITDTLKQSVLQTLDAPMESWDDNMFNGLQSEILILLTDTFKRLKLSDSFRRAYIKCKGMRSGLLEERLDNYQ